MKNKIALLSLLLLTVACNEFASEGSEFAPVSESATVLAEAPTQESPGELEQVPGSGLGPAPTPSDSSGPAPSPAPAPSDSSEPAPAPAPSEQSPAPAPSDSSEPAPAPAPSEQSPAPSPSDSSEQAPAPTPSEQSPAPAPSDSSGSAPAPAPQPEPEIVKVPSEPLEVIDACNEMSNDSVAVESGHGLVGQIYDGSKLKAKNFSQVKSEGSKTKEKVYFSSLNISSAKNQGFAKPEGGVVLNSEGAPLTSDFGIQLQTNLVLQQSDEEGLYQLSVIADDGVIIESNGQQLISAGQQGPTKYSCSSDLIKMVKGSSVPLSIQYFQGSQKEIALILMWRKVKNLDGSLVAGTSEEDLNEKRCGQAGNHFFFDSSAGVQPTMDIKELSDSSKRKLPWKVVNHKNFKLSQSVSNQACVKEETITCSGNKVLICHFPPGNPAAAHNICIDEKGWLNGHKGRHDGDHLGACE